MKFMEPYWELVCKQCNERRDLPDINSFRSVITGALEFPDHCGQRMNLHKKKHYIITKCTDWRCLFARNQNCKCDKCEGLFHKALTTY